MIHIMQTYGYYCTELLSFSPSLFLLLLLDAVFLSLQQVSEISVVTAVSVSLVVAVGE